MAQASESIIEAADDGRRYEPFRFRQCEQSERAHGEVAEANLAYNGERSVILDGKDVLGGESGLRNLARSAQE